mmetsp:Transcript_8527/g.9625  ORF Transcript_8527/g.9625 Transcript_8527/m.9625 type:complete len:120 (+) Transcript_8527:21-380(+)
MAGIAVHSIGQALAVPLRTWVMGGILLSLPSSWAIHNVVKQKGIRSGFIVESAAVAASFVWLSWGTVLLSSFPQGMHTCPLLWWACFGQCVLTWSCISITVFALILTTLLSLLPVASTS